MEVALSLSLLVLAASMGAFVFFLIDRALQDEGGATPATPAPTATPQPGGGEGTPPPTAATATVDDAAGDATRPPPTVPAGATYAGEPPEGVDAAGLARVNAEVDLAFLDGGEGRRIVRRHYVPVAAMGAGVDALTGAQLEALARDEIADWAEVGGIAGPVRAFAIADGEERAAMAAFAPIAPDRTFATWPELLAALTLDSGAWAFVPLDAVGPTVTAIAVDGIDLVRGRGDASRWPYIETVTLAAFTAQGRIAAEALAAEYAAALPEPITVIATGDILQSRCSLTRIRATGDWGAALRGPVGEYLASADLTLGSVDGSIQDIAEPLGCFNHINLSSPPEVIEALTLSGFDEVTVATNHVFDCGAELCEDRAFLRTIELLEAAGIAVVGGGRNLEEALEPATFRVGETTFGVLGFDDVAALYFEAGPSSSGTAPLDDSYADERASGEPAYFRPASELGLERFRARIRALAEEVDVVIVQVQSGTEDTHDPSPRSVKALRAAVEEGAALVVGNQAHHVQAIEVGPEAFAAYALGNFIYDQTRLEEHRQGYLLEATFWGARLVNVRFMPYQIEDLYRPVFAEGALRAKILNDVFQAALRLARGP